MKITIKKLFSVILATLMLLTIPVFASAEDAGEEKNLYDFSSGEIVAVNGKWMDDYVNVVEVTIKGGAKYYDKDNIIVTVGTNETADNIKTMKSSDFQSIKVTSTTVTLRFRLDMKIDHGTTYYVEIKEGAFTDASGKVNSAFRIGITGNALLDPLSDDPLPISPIQKLIYFIDNSQYKILLYPILLILKWFVSL